jgi:hypothetical protein
MKAFCCMGNPRFYLTTIHPSVLLLVALMLTESLIVKDEPFLLSYED